jgi:hypothetical protein
MSHDFSLALKKRIRQGASAAQWNVLHAKGLDDPIHTPLDFTFSTSSSSQKKKDHVTFNRKCGVLNRRDDERKYRSVYIVARVRERRKKTITNIQMKTICAVRRKEMSI